MSLTCRRIKAQGSDKEYYWVQNSGVSPTVVDLYETLEDVPKEIRHYCENLDVITVGPGMADFMGIGDQLFPDFPICDCPIVYVENVDDEILSEFGSIGIEPRNGGVIRTA